MQIKKFRITQEEVTKILDLAELGIPRKWIAKRMDRPPDTISDVCTGKHPLSKKIVNDRKKNENSSPLNQCE